MLPSYLSSTFYARKIEHLSTHIRILVLMFYFSRELCAALRVYSCVCVLISHRLGFLILLVRT